MKENPLIPMGAITGTPSKGLISETLQSYKEVGITQFLIYPRTGCELEYMSEEWLNTCRFILEEAERLDFTSIWLYDEYNWPSGRCNNQVMKTNSDFEMKQMCVYPQNGEYHFAIRSNPNMADLLNPAAVECFINLTHEKYAQYLGKYMGNLLKGIFTDEPEIGHFSYANKEDILRLPYYPGLEEDYAELTQSNLKNDIKAGLKNGSMFFMNSCNKLLAKRFRKIFVDKINEWCSAHNILFTGHLMSESSSGKAQKCNGHPLEILSGFSLPGMDEIFTWNSIETMEWLTFGTLMYAIEKQGNKGGLAELFALGPCDLSFNRMRQQIWMAALFGVDHYVLAVAALDHRGNIEKGDYFNPFTRTQAWFEGFKELGIEAANAAGYAGKERVYQVNVRYPYSPTPLTNLLKHLVESQYSWKLIHPHDKADANIVLAFDKDEIYDEKSNEYFRDYPNMRSWLAQNINKLPLVETPEGKKVSDIFIRHFKDGSVVVIDLSGTSRVLCIKRNGQELLFKLEKNGIARFPGWEISFDRENTLRADFKDGEFRFVLAEEIDNFVLAIRNYGDIPELLLDDHEIEFSNICNKLPQGITELYLESSQLNLKAGNHLLKLRNAIEDSAYLPLAIFIGKFAKEKENILLKHGDFRNNLYGYSGKITQNAKIEVPVNASIIRLEPDDLCTELWINGKSCGKRLWAPFEWLLPAGVQGKTVEIKIERLTSCGPIFGEKAFETLNMHELFGKCKPDNSVPMRPCCEIIWK